jgi:hypothetical protein
LPYAQLDVAACSSFDCTYEVFDTTRIATAIDSHRTAQLIALPSYHLKHTKMNNSQAANAFTSTNQVANGGIEKKKKNRPGQKARKAKKRQQLALLEAGQGKHGSLDEPNGDTGEAADQEPNGVDGHTPDKEQSLPGQDELPELDQGEEKEKKKKKKKKKSKANIARDKAKSEKWLAARDARAQAAQDQKPADSRSGMMTLSAMPMFLLLFMLTDHEEDFGSDFSPPPSVEELREHEGKLRLSAMSISFVLSTNLFSKTRTSGAISRFPLIQGS